MEDYRGSSAINGHSQLIVNFSQNENGVAAFVRFCWFNAPPYVCSYIAFRSKLRILTGTLMRLTNACYASLHATNYYVPYRAYGDWQPHSVYNYERCSLHRQSRHGMHTEFFNLENRRKTKTYTMYESEMHMCITHIHTASRQWTKKCSLNWDRDADGITILYSNNAQCTLLEMHARMLLIVRLWPNQ